MLRFIRNLLFIAALALGIAFGYVNFQQVTVDFLWSDARVPLVVILVVSFVVGFALALLLLIARMVGLQTNLGKTRRQLKDAQAEIRNLRSMPIHDA